ncbi:MAG: Ig-like domain-containing protein [Geminicoccaceae bacterium]
MPSAYPDSATTSAQTPVIINLLGNDDDGGKGPLSIISLSEPANGSVKLNADQTVTYTPFGSFTGQDSFTYAVRDTAGTVASSNVSIDVTAQQPPVAQPDSVEVMKNGSVRIYVLSNDSDPDGDPLFLTGLGTPAHGSVTVNGDHSITYRPHQNYTGPDSFIYLVSDGRGGSSSATVSLTVKQATTLEAVADVVTTAPDTPVTIRVLANDSSSDGSAFFLSAVGQPSHGTIKLNPDLSIQYTPNAGFEGDDSFIYAIGNADGVSSTAQVTVTVAAIAPPPEPVNDMVSTPADTPIEINVLDNDVNPGTGTLQLVSVGTPSNGSVSLLPDLRIRYTPNAGFSGEDSFLYAVRNDGGTVTANVTVMVGEVADVDAGGYRAVALDLGTVTDGMSHTEQTEGQDSDWFKVALPAGNLDTIYSLTVRLTGGLPSTNMYFYDTAGVPMGNTVDREPKELTFQGLPGGVWYTGVWSAEGAKTPFTLTYELVELTRGTSSYVRQVGEDNPDTQDQLTGSGLNDDLRGFAGADSLSGGGNADYLDGGAGDDTLTGGTGDDIVTGGIGNDVYVYRKGDGYDTILELSGTDQINLVDATPSEVVLERDGDDLKIYVAGNAAMKVAGHFAVSGQAIESIFFQATSQTWDSAAILSRLISSDPVAPVANDDSVSTQVDTALTFAPMTNDLDLNPQDSLTIISVGSPTAQGGSVSMVNGGTELAYTPPAGFTGTDSFTYRLSDGTFESNDATVSVTVSDPSAVSAQVYSLAELQNAINAAQAGDIIEMMPSGSFVGQIGIVNKVGTAANPIEIRFNGLIEGNESTYGTIGQLSVVFDNSHHVRFGGYRMTNQVFETFPGNMPYDAAYLPFLIRGSCSNIEVHDIVWSGTTTTNWGVGGGRGLIIVNVGATDCILRRLYTENMGSQSDLDFVTVHNSWSNGYCNWPRRLLIEDCIAVNCPSFYAGFQLGQSGQYYTASLPANYISDQVVIRRCAQINSGGWGIESKIPCRFEYCYTYAQGPVGNYGRASGIYHRMGQTNSYLGCASVGSHGFGWAALGHTGEVRDLCNLSPAGGATIYNAGAQGTVNFEGWADFNPNTRAADFVGCYFHKHAGTPNGDHTYSAAFQFQQTWYGPWVFPMDGSHCHVNDNGRINDISFIDCHFYGGNNAWCMSAINGNTTNTGSVTFSNCTKKGPEYSNIQPPTWSSVATVADWTWKLGTGSQPDMKGGTQGLRYPGIEGHWNPFGVYDQYRAKDWPAAWYDRVKANAQSL